MSDELDLIEIPWEEQPTEETVLTPWLRISTKRITIPIPDVEANKCLTWKVNIKVDCNYSDPRTMVGVVGYSIIQTSYLSVFRIYVEKEKTLVIGVKNLSGKKISNRNMMVQLLLVR